MKFFSLNSFQLYGITVTRFVQLVALWQMLTLMKDFIAWYHDGQLPVHVSGGDEGSGTLGVQEGD